MIKSCKLGGNNLRKHLLWYLIYKKKKIGVEWGICQHIALNLELS